MQIHHPGKTTAQIQETDPCQHLEHTLTELSKLKDDLTQSCSHKGEMRGGKGIFPSENTPKILSSWSRSFERLQGQAGDNDGTRQST